MQRTQCEGYGPVRLVTIEVTLPVSLGRMAGHDWVRALLNTASSAPVATSDRVRDAVRNALRATGFKPAGRNKPCPEYLARVAAEGGLPSINPVADIGNAVALHSGLPVSVVDPDRLTEPLSVRVAEEGSKYVFNASGQEIDVGRLVCLFDAVGPCACAVKDAQRAKTTPDTARALNLIWGCEALADHVAATEKWFRELLAELGARERE